MESGDIRPLHPEVVAYALMGIAHFQALRWILWADTDNPSLSPEIQDAIFAFITQGLGRTL